MRHKKQKVTIDRKAGPRKALIRIMSIQLLQHGHLTTTPVKAGAVRRLVERMITRGKTKSVHTIRLIESRLNKDAALLIVNTVAPRFADRNGGYTRLTKIAPRKGDGAAQVVLELISE